MLSVPPGAALEERVPRVLPPDAITASNWGVMSKNGRSLCTDLRVYPPNLDGRFDWMWRTTQEAFYGRMRIGSTGWLMAGGWWAETSVITPEHCGFVGRDQSRLNEHCFRASIAASPCRP